MVSDFCLKLNEFRKNDKYCDVSIHVEDVIFRCHRVVLASVSDYFDRVFSGNFKEGSTGCITLTEINPVTFNAILEFIYVQSKPTIHKDNVYELLSTSDYLSISTIKTDCVTFILGNPPSVSNVLKIFNYACSMNEYSLRDSLIHHILFYFSGFARHNLFLELPYDTLTVLLQHYRSSHDTLFEIVSHDTLFENENFLLDTLIRWLRFLSTDREKYLEDIIKAVDLKKIMPTYKEFIAKEYNINLPEELSCHDYDEVLNDSSLLTESLKVVVSSMCIDTESPTVYRDNREALGITPAIYWYICCNDDSLYRVFSIKDNNNKVIYKENCSFFRPDTRPSVGRSLLIASNPDEYCYRYLYHLEYSLSTKGCCKFYSCPSVNMFSQPNILSPCPCSNNFLLLDGCATNNWLYVHEKQTAENEYPFIHCYKYHTNKWFELPEMKRKTQNGHLLADDDMVYMIGGESFNYYTDHRYVQAYDHRVPIWIDVFESKKREYLPRSVVCLMNEKIYLMNQSGLEAFDFTARKWEKLYEIDEGEYVIPCKMIPYSDKLWLFYKTFKDESDLFFYTYNVKSRKWGSTKVLDKMILPPYSLDSHIVVFNES